MKLHKVTKCACAYYCAVPDQKIFMVTSPQKGLQSPGDRVGGGGGSVRPKILKKPIIISRGVLGGGGLSWGRYMGKVHVWIFSGTT